MSKKDQTTLENAEQVKAKIENMFSDNVNKDIEAKLKGVRESFKNTASMVASNVMPGRELNAILAKLDLACKKTTAAVMKAK